STTTCCTRASSTRSSRASRPTSTACASSRSKAAAGATWWTASWKRKRRGRTMLTPSAGPLRPRVLIVDDALGRPETAIGRAAESIAAALAARNCDVVRALSFEDGEAIVGFDASLRAVLLNWHLGTQGKEAREQAPALLRKLRERLPGVP